MNMETKYMLLMGPSRVGKNTIMHKLAKIDNRFVQIKPHVTRLLRTGETDRVSVTICGLHKMRRNGEATKINCVYGEYFAAYPKKKINEALEAGMFPMADYKISSLQDDMMLEFPGRLYRVYLLPPSFDVIRERFRADGATINPGRMKADQAEVLELDTTYKDLIDFRIVNEEGMQEETAETVRLAYLSELQRNL